MKNENQKKIIGVLGTGQVGGAIKKLTKKYFSVLTKNLSEDNLKNNKIDILHVCIPYTKDFSNVVVKQTLLNKPNLVIINLTIKPGTTRQIFNNTKINIVHSPVMGVHPKLYYYLFQFPKFIGPINKTSGKLAKKHFVQMDLKTIVLNNPEETELAKLFDTTYYGLNIVFCKWVKEICSNKKLNFSNVYTKFNHAYNEGYKNTLPNVIRPILKPVPGPIGGTCVVSNAKILNEFIPNKISKLIKEAK